MIKRIINIQVCWALALSAFLYPINARAKPIDITVEAGLNQKIFMAAGAQIIISQMPKSYVSMTAPEPFDSSRVQIVFVFKNDFDQPIDIGPENITGSLAVVTYDQLIAEQDRSDKSSAFAALLGAVGNSLTASSTGGYRQEQRASAGFQSCGMGCVTPYATTQTVKVYDPALARQAQAQAEAENRARFNEIDAESALARSKIAINLRTTTVMPGQVLSGTLTFQVPKEIRKSKVERPLALYVRVGTDLHVIQGYIGPVGAPRGNSGLPPQRPNTPTTSAVPAASYSSAVPIDSSLSIEAYRRGEYRNAPGKIMLLAEKGYPEAQYGLGFAYLYGVLLAPNKSLALRWLTAASDRGANEASYQLGLYYETSLTDRDRLLSQQFYQLAAEQGNQDAATVLGLKKKLTPNDLRNSLPRPPIPANAAAQWVTGNDYPGISAARRKGGTAEFRATVSPNGAVVQCSIIVSSGEKDLDDRTCGLISSRSLFHPARDASGRASEGTYQNRVRWVPPAP